MNNPEMTLTPPVFLVRPFAGDRIPTERLSCVVYNFQSQCPPRRSPGLGAAECRNEDSSLSFWPVLAHLGAPGVRRPTTRRSQRFSETRASVRVRKTIQGCQCSPAQDHRASRLAFCAKSCTQREEEDERPPNRQYVADADGLAMLLSSSRDVIRVVLPRTDVLFGLGRRLLSSMWRRPSEPRSRVTVAAKIVLVFGPENSWPEVKLNSRASRSRIIRPPRWLLVRFIKYRHAQIKLIQPANTNRNMKLALVISAFIAALSSDLGAFAEVSSSSIAGKSPVSCQVKRLWTKESSPHS